MTDKIRSTKLLTAENVSFQQFEQPVQKLREALNTIDECTEHGHYSRPLNVLNSKGETQYYELAGHPLPCTSDCQSSLRVLRAAATHFPLSCAD